MTKTSRPSTDHAQQQQQETETVKEVHPQWPSDSDQDHDAPKPPASVLALAAAAHRASSGRRSATAVSHSHRRSQTIVAAGDLEMELLHKHKAVEELHTELESKNKALEESQEEAQLAARIGQTLLQRNQEMGAESESKAIELQNRAESAEQVAKVLEKKLSLASAQIRSLEIARTRATLEAEQLTQELDASCSRIQRHQAESVRAKEELSRVQSSKMRVEEELEMSQQLVERAEAAQRKLQAELAATNERIEVLTSSERHNVEHIYRLEIENQSICQQQHVLAHREKQLQLENEAVAFKLAASGAIIKDHIAKCQGLESTIASLHAEMEDLREALHVEQTRVMQLTRHNEELDARVDRHRRMRELSDADGESMSHRLRNGSLFYELSRQLRDDIQPAEAKSPVDSASKTESLSPKEPTAGSMESPARSSTRTSRNVSSNNTDSVGEGEEAQQADRVPSGEKKSRPPPLQLERRRSQQEEEAETVRVVVDASPRESRDEDGDDRLLKEFFVLTAAAVKIAGGGLRNDACNIHNEDLFAEAMKQGVTFDQFHKWLESRLEDDLEISLSPPKVPASAPPQPARRASLSGFWTR